MTDWRVFITPAAERAARKLPSPARTFILEEFPHRVAADPLIGEPLTAPLAWLRSFHFSSESKPYRIAYAIESSRSRIVIHYAGYRGGFYERLRKLLRV